jgi:hypothetical protein
MSLFTEEPWTAPRQDLAARGVRLEDFYGYMPQHMYIFSPCREPWPAASVNARLPSIPVLDKDGRQKLDRRGRPMFIPASTWIDRHQPVEQMTWCPGMPMLIPNRLVSDGGWIEREAVTVFNLYRPPRIKPGNAAAAGPWVDHVRYIYPDDYLHIIEWLAQRVQRPEEKINHALVLGGPQGIGKDTLRSSTRSGRGTSTTYHRRTCSVPSTASPSRCCCGSARRGI